MYNLCQRTLSPVLTAVFAGSILGFSCAVRAEDEPDGPAPTTSPNIATANPDPTREMGTSEAGPQFSEETHSSGTTEPGFGSETSRMTWPNVPLLVTGVTSFGLSYIPAVLGGALSDADHRKDLYIPVAGPWMMFAKSDDVDGGEKVLLAVDGVVQGLGALMLVSSFFIPEKKTEHWYLIGSNDSLRIAPSNVGTGYGMGAAGRF